jgi:hypothetical protein
MRPTGSKRPSLPSAGFCEAAGLSTRSVLISSAQNVRILRILRILRPSCPPGAGERIPQSSAQIYPCWTRPDPPHCSSLVPCCFVRSRTDTSQGKADAIRGSMAYKKHASVKEVANLPASATLVEKVELSLCGRKFTQSHFEWNPADAYLTGIWKSRDSKSLTWLASLAEEHRQRQSQLPQGYRNWVENDYLPLPSSDSREWMPHVLTADQEAILDEIYPTAPRAYTIDPECAEELKRAILREFRRSLASVLLENCITGKHPELAAGLLFSREPIPVRETSIPWLERCMMAKFIPKFAGAILPESPG